MKHEKSWFWDRNKKRDQMEKLATLRNEVINEADLPKHKALSLVKTKLRWFTKEINALTARFSIDGGEGEVGFYLSIPWLFSISVDWEYINGEFKKRYPKIAEDDADVTWGFTLNKTYISLSWREYRTMFGERKGWNWMEDWVDLLRGRNTKVVWTKHLPVLKIQMTVFSSYKLDSYPKEVNILDEDKMLDAMRAIHTSAIKPRTLEELKRNPGLKYGLISVGLTVYERTGTWYFTRWFPTKHKQYGVTSDVGIIVPGKGENSYDQDDELCQSFYHEETDNCDFSVGSAKSPIEAAQAYINSIERKLKR